jgi:hypothetical protein
VETSHKLQRSDAPASNNVISASSQPEAIDDPLPEMWRVGARELLAKAIEAEIEEFLAALRVGNNTVLERLTPTTARTSESR